MKDFLKFMWEDWIGGILSLLCLAVIGLIAAWIIYETKCPCLQYGEERVLYYQQTGGIILPVYGADCIQRDKCK